MQSVAISLYSACRHEIESLKRFTTLGLKKYCPIASDWKQLKDGFPVPGIKALFKLAVDTLKAVIKKARHKAGLPISGFKII